MNDADGQKLLQELTAAIDRYDVPAAEVAWHSVRQHLQDNPAATPERFLRILKDAVDRFDHKCVGRLCDEFVKTAVRGDAPWPIETGRETLALLRGKRHFDGMIQIAETLMQSGERDHNVRRQYAQALLDGGQVGAALSLLGELKIDCEAANDEEELAEVLGLIGRGHKQAFINSTRRGVDPERSQQSLDQGIAAYRDVYAKNPNKVWHGINTIALRRRAERDGHKMASATTADVDYAAAAADVLKTIKAKKDRNLWDDATAVEAALATDDYDEALKWTLSYTQRADGDAFEYAGTLRQFEEVWQLDSARPEHAQILQLLRSSLLHQEGGRVDIQNLSNEQSIAAQLAGNTHFEAVLGKDRFKTFRWYATGIDRATAVAKIVDKFDQPFGTGFLLRGTDVHESISEPFVLATNAHVISDDAREQRDSPSALAAADAHIVFEAGEHADAKFKVGRILFSSGRNELDCTIVTIEGTIGADKPYPIAKRLPELDKNQRVYVIGHPRGGGLSFSMNDNLLLDHNQTRVQYRAPTEGGSSGSPVFNASWKLIALHHRGGMEMPRLHNKPGTHAANQGIALQSILRDVALKLS